RGRPARLLAERYQPIDVGEQAVRMLQDSPKIPQENLAPAVLRLFGEQLAITLDGVQRSPQLMAESAAIGLSAKPVRRVCRRAVDDPLDQRQELHRSRSHPLEIEDAIIQAVAPGVLDENIDETDDPGDRCGEFLPD